jgi:hypothetical protein
VTRRLAAGALLGVATLSAHVTHAQERWVDDEAVQPALGVKATGGFGVASLTYPGAAGMTRALVGTGSNLEAVLGLGRGFEVGIRVGLRIDDNGRGLRADEVARGLYPPTFGTGLSTVPNPELQLRWRAVQVRWLEAGIVDRVVLPTGSDPNVTEVIGMWLAAHGPGATRADVGLDGAFSWQSFQTGYVLQLAFALPIRLWINVTPGLFAGFVSTPVYYASTSYTTSYLNASASLVAGYRFGRCDLTAGAHLVDIVNSGTDRAGLGVGLSCRFGARRKQT